MPHMNKTIVSQRGTSVPVVITIVLLSLFAVAFAGLSVWAYVNYVDQRDRVNLKIDAAVAIAEKEQADELETKFLEREKEPNREFAGPSDYGTLSFKYPKTWSVYVANDGSQGDTFEAYLNPIVVPAVSEDERFALRVSIVSQKYEDVLEEYQGLVEDGALKTSVAKVNGETGTRLDGNFSENIRGAAVIYKIRDKTAVVRTDAANTFKSDFEKLIKTITFNN